MTQAGTAGESARAYPSPAVSCILTTTSMRKALRPPGATSNPITSEALRGRSSTAGDAIPLQRVTSGRLAERSLSVPTSVTSTRSSWGRSTERAGSSTAPLGVPDKEMGMSAAAILAQRKRVLAVMVGLTTVIGLTSVISTAANAAPDDERRVSKAELVAGQIQDLVSAGN